MALSKSALVSLLGTYGYSGAITVTYDGSGGTGGVTLIDPGLQLGVISAHTSPVDIQDAIRDYVEDAVETAYPDWADGLGAEGTVTLNVTTSVVTIDHTTRLQYDTLNQTVL